MQQTTNYNLNKFDSTDELESATRLGLNENADTIDTALKGIQDDIDGLDASEVSYDNTVSGLTATDVQAALDEELGKIDILSTDYIVEQGTNYRKWNSGLAECWGTSQSGVNSAVRYNIVFPVTFNANPTVVASSGAGGGRFPYYVEDVTPTSFNFYVARGSNTSTVWLHYYAIGTWK